MTIDHLAYENENPEDFRRSLVEEADRLTIRTVEYIGQSNGPTFLGLGLGIFHFEKSRPLPLVP